MNYFELFNIEANYIISTNHLKKMYLQLQAKYHPDRAKSSSEKIEFLDKSTYINSGYKILMDDYLRAEYLLRLDGYTITDVNSKNLLSPDDLELIWIRNEQIEQATTIEEMFALEKEFLSDQTALVDELQSCFDGKNIHKALELTVKLKYLTNLVKNIRLKIKDANN